MNAIHCQPFKVYFESGYIFNLGLDTQQSLSRNLLCRQVNKVHSDVRMHDIDAVATLIVNGKSLALEASLEFRTVDMSVLSI